MNSEVCQAQGEDSLLDEFEDWQKALASDLLLQNPTLSKTAIDALAQRMMNRVIFLHITENRHSDSVGLPDTLDVDDHVLHKMIRGLREFGIIRCDILGRMHERFIGNSNLRKSGGVFYTPAYIVNPIIDQTLGRLLHGKTTADAAKLRILDPACGSGAFLIGAYQYLLDWHQNHLAGNRRLSIVERMRILTDTIFGVDLDPAAVEVARLTLLLKCVEDTHEEISLPDLRDNLMCGNSLVDSRITTDKGWKELTDTEQRQINPFNYETAFPSVFKRGGFDAVIGNPPYLNGVEASTRMSDLLNRWTRKNYVSARGAIDASILFQELGLRLTKFGGYSSMIVPNKFLCAPFGKAFRTFASSHGQLVALADYSKVPVFKDVAVYPVVYVIRKGDGAISDIDLQIHPRAQQHEPGRMIRSSIRANLSQIDSWSELFSSNRELISKIGGCSVPFSEVFEITASASAGEAYELLNAVSDSAAGPDKFPLISSGCIDRYHHHWGRIKIRYLKQDFTAPVLNLNSQWISKNRRRQYRSPKIILAGMTRRLEAIIDAGYVAGSVPTVQILNRHPPRRESLKYLLAIVNSKLSNWFFQQQFSSLSLAGGYLRIGVPQVSALRYRCIDFSNELETRRHNNLVGAVEAMLKLHARHALKTQSEEIRCAISVMDRQIDQMVYELYGLSESEIQIVEESV